MLVVVWGRGGLGWEVGGGRVSILFCCGGGEGARRRREEEGEEARSGLSQFVCVDCATTDVVVENHSLQRFTLRTLLC